MANRILSIYGPADAGRAEAAAIASHDAVRRLVRKHRLERLIGVHIKFSRPARLTLLSADKAALRAYRRGDADDPLVVEYFPRAANLVDEKHLLGIVRVVDDGPS